MQYNIKKLEENITDIIAESQLKLGYTDFITHRSLWRLS